MIFVVEVNRLTSHQESLLLDFVIETIKYFVVESNDFCVFLKEDVESNMDNESNEVGRGDASRMKYHEKGIQDR